MSANKTEHSIEDLEVYLSSFEWNINHELNKLYVDQDYESAKTRVAFLFLNYKKFLFKKNNENLNSK